MIRQNVLVKREKAVQVASTSSALLGCHLVCIANNKYSPLRTSTSDVHIYIRFLSSPAPYPPTRHAVPATNILVRKPTYAATPIKAVPSKNAPRFLCSIPPVLLCRISSSPPLYVTVSNCGTYLKSNTVCSPANPNLLSTITCQKILFRFATFRRSR